MGFNFNLYNQLGSQSNGTTALQGYYDANYIRHVSDVNSANRKVFIYAGSQLLGEINATGSAPVAAYTWGPDGIISERILTGTPKSLWYHYGPQGETRRLTNNVGAVTDSYVFNAYGRPIAFTGSNSNPFRYGGKYGYYTESFSGLILAGARWYHPYLQRWMNRDPVLYKGGTNLYEYVKGRPMRFVDPDGLTPFENDTGDIVRVKPESGPAFPPSFCGTQSCDVDGVLDIDPPYKIPDQCSGYYGAQCTNHGPVHTVTPVCDRDTGVYLPQSLINWYRPPGRNSELMDKNKRPDWNKNKN